MSAFQVKFSYFYGKHQRNDSGLWLKRKPLMSLKNYVPTKLEAPKENFTDYAWEREETLIAKIRR